MTTTMTPIPMPGRLPVDVDTGLGEMTLPLDEIPEGVRVRAFGRLKECQPVSATHSMLVLEDHAGDTAYGRAETRMLAESVRWDTSTSTLISFRVSGVVARRTPGQPATIDVNGFRVVRV